MVIVFHRFHKENIKISLLVVIPSTSYEMCIFCSLYILSFSNLERLSDLQKDYSEAARTIKGQKELISQLEGDLLSVNALPSSYRGQGEVR